MCLAQSVTIIWLLVVVGLFARNFHTYRTWYYARTGRDFAAMTPKSLTALFKERHGNLLVEALRRRAVATLVTWVTVAIGGMGLILALVAWKPCF